MYPGFEKVFVGACVYGMIFSWPVYAGHAYLMNAMNAQLSRKTMIDPAALGEMRQKRIILIAEVLLVVIFNWMSQVGCFASTRTHAADNLEEELGECARGLMGPLWSRGSS